MSQPPKRESKKHQEAGAGARESLSGVIERVTFHSPDSGFCVLQVKSGSRREAVTVVGNLSQVSPGEHIQASGEWQNTVEHGVQFKAALLTTTPPSTREGMERYLGSGLIGGIGKEFAKRLVAAFGDQVFDVIDHHPERLKTVEGIGPKRLQSILDGWAEQKAIRDIMVFLQSNGVGTSRSVRIYKVYGADAVPLISEDPYRLAREIRGIGFRTADEIAARLGIPRDSILRARAGVTFTLSQAVDRGHCGLARHELLRQAEEILEIGNQILETALELEIEEQVLIEDQCLGERTVFLEKLWRAERAIAEHLLDLGRGEASWAGLDADVAIPWAENKLDVQLADSQRLAVKAALRSKVLVITGGPGVGKTTLVNAILTILTAKGVSVDLCAPTGRAAKRLAESTGRPARTIHRLLEFDPRLRAFKRNQDSPLEVDLLVADEVSMVDVPLMAALLEALPKESGLLLVGDVDQLPSVGPGQVLRDVIDSDAVPVARLTEIFRQAESSQIVVNAHRVNRGQMPNLDPPTDGLSDFYFVEANSPEELHRKLVEMVARRIPQRFGLDPKTEVQVLVPMNRGPLGARALNLVLQQALNPPRYGEATVERFGSVYRVGDKVMQTENDYDRDVFNGDLGEVVEIERDAQEVVLRFGDRRVTYSFGELDQVMLAYATTIHKSQGSEYPAVVIPLAMQHYMMLRPNLVYTGITRGKRLVILVGERRALRKAVKADDADFRRTKLREWLSKGNAGRQAIEDIE
jgi:exodeoxyribonuclease V alpha subunit